jgi:hypothetical protein
MSEDCDVTEEETNVNKKVTEATIVVSLSPQGRGRGEGGRTMEFVLKLPNPLILSFSREEGTQRARCAFASQREKRPPDADKFGCPYLAARLIQDFSSSTGASPADLNAA